MQSKEARFAAQYRYAAKNLHRVPLDLKNADYERLKSAASAVGESINGYVKVAINQRIERDSTKQEDE